MTKQIINVYAATVDREKVVLFHDTTQTVLFQGDTRIPEIIEILKTKQFNVTNPVAVDISPRLPKNEVLGKFAEKNPFIRLYRIAKNTLRDMFDREAMAEARAKAALAYNETTPLVPGSYGSLQTPPTKERVEGLVNQEKQLKNKRAIEQIQANARPLEYVAEDTTVVGVVGDTIIPGVENITEQLKHAVEHDSQGAQRFFQRLGLVEGMRRHTAEDLMKFLQRGDLPLAEDGSIIAYKILKETNVPGVFADPHTGKVRQKVGDRVCMDASLVDPDRNRECSNGLHVARVDYLPQFSGTHIFLIRIHPEDVIAVPYADGSKMRVRSYEILVELPQEIRSLLLSRRSMLNHPEGAAILQKALTAGWSQPVREVRITGQMGNGIVVTSLDNGSAPTVTVTNTPVEEMALDTAPAPVPVILNESKEPVVTQKAAPVLPQTIAKERTSKQKQQGKPSAAAVAGSRQEKAVQLLRAFQKGRSNAAKVSAATELKKFKRESKVGWDRLGISATEVAVVEDFLQKHG